MANLTKAQQHVVDRMKEGWEMGKSETFSGRAWLQKNGVGRGGETERVNIGTFCALFNRKIIRQKKRGFPTSIYELVENEAD